MDTKLETLKPRDHSIDVLRMIAILAVVLIHTSTRVLEVTHYDLNNFGWDLFLNQISRFAVPLFFIISGFVLELNYDFHTSYLSFFKKRITKILIPYFFWSAIFYLLIFQNHDFSFIKALLDGSSSYQLYFIPALLIFYFLFPLIHKFYKFISNKWIFVALGGIELLLLRQDYFIKPLAINYSLRIVILNYFMFVAGIIAAHNREIILRVTSKLKFILIPIFLYFGSIIFTESKAMYFKIWNIDAIYSQWRPSIFIYTILLALLLYYIFTKFKLKFVEKISSLSFFVFFIHTFILEVVWRFLSNKDLKNPLIDPLFFVSVAIISFGIAYIAHKIPKFSKLTG